VSHESSPYSFASHLHSASKARDRKAGNTMDEMEAEAHALPELPAADASPVSEERTAGLETHENQAPLGGDDLSHQCEFVAGPPPWKGHKTSAIWNYFCHLDLEVHPDMKHWRLCNVCRRRGVDKAVNVTESSSTGKMIEHLKRCHHDEYLQFQKEKEDKLKERAASKEAVGGPAVAFAAPSASSVKKQKQRMKLDDDFNGNASIIHVGNSNTGDEKSNEEVVQEELHRLLEIQKIAEERLDAISDRLEQSRTVLSPFDLAMLQDRKESAVKNVQAVGKKVDGLCDKLNNEIYV
jgi:hypothetical protein